MSTAPKFKAAAMRCARATSPVQQLEARPYGVSFARLIASASSVKGSATSTGPKTSCCTISLDCCAPTMSVGAK